MREEKGARVVMYIHGENIQVLPNAMFCHSIYLLGPGRKAGGRFGKDGRPDPERRFISLLYLDERCAYDFVPNRPMPGCGQILRKTGAGTDLSQRGLLRLRGTGQTYQEQGIHQRHHPPSFPSSERKELALSGGRSQCAGEGQRLHILIFRGEMFAIKEKNDIFCLNKENEL